MVRLQEVLLCKVFVPQWRNLGRGEVLQEGDMVTALGATTPCRCLGEETHLLIPECGVDTCCWRRNQSLFLGK